MKMAKSVAGVLTHTHTCSFKRVKRNHNTTNVNKEERQFIMKT